jgi:hypothetical protein
MTASESRENDAAGNSRHRLHPSKSGSSGSAAPLEPGGLPNPEGGHQ